MGQNRLRNPVPCATFCFQIFTSLKIPSTAPHIPGKGGRAPSHGGFRSRSGAVNQTPPSPPPARSVQTSTISGRGKSAQRRGSARGALPAHGCGGGAAKSTATPAPVREALPQNRGGPAAHPRTPPGTKFAGQPGLRRGGGGSGASPARRAAPGPPGPLRGRPHSLPGLRDRERRGAAPSATGPPRTPPRCRRGPR